MIKELADDVARMVVEVESPSTAATGIATQHSSRSSVVRGEVLRRPWNTTPVAAQPPLLEEEGKEKEPPRLLRNHPSSKRRGKSKNHPGCCATTPPQRGGEKSADVIPVSYLHDGLSS